MRTQQDIDNAFKPDGITFKIVKCVKCGNLLDIEPNINKGTGIVYTCTCGHRTGIRTKNTPE